MYIVFNFFIMAVFSVVVVKIKELNIIDRSINIL